jgi:tetratricopeptide (TPR) repeat protein
MSQLLEILGRAIKVDTSDLIWHWLNLVISPAEYDKNGQYRLLYSALELIAEKKPFAATEQLRLYLFENPSCIYGRLAAAAICLNNNKINEAIKELNSVYMRRPNNTLALYALGYCYERLGKESQAVEFYQDCLKFKLYLQLPAQRLAAIYFKNEQYEKTIEQYQLLNSEYPDDISTLITLGHLFIITGKYSKAIETFNTAILMHPDNFFSDDNDIDQLMAEGQIYEALEQIEYLLQADSERPDLLIKQADILRMMGAAADAVSQYEQAIRLCPDFLEATIKLGTQYLQLNQDNLAAELFNKAIEINDKIVDAYIGLAISQQLAGNSTEALSTLSLAAAISPNSSLLFSEMAALHFKQGIKNENIFASEVDSVALTKAIITAHQKQITLHPQNPDLYYRLGILMMGIGDEKKAIDSFISALEINPLYARARSKLIVCLYQTGRKSDALKYLSDYNHLDRDTLSLHYQTALLYCDKLKFASTLFNLERYMENNYSCPDASLNISIVLQNIGLLDRAAFMWDNLSDLADHAISSS